VSAPVFISDEQQGHIDAVAPGDISITDAHKNAASIMAVHSATELPLRIGIVIDTSRSQASSRVYGAFVGSLTDFVNKALKSPTDQVFIETFDSSVAKPTRMMDQVEFSQYKLNLQPGGATAVYDAVDKACTFLDLNSAPDSRRVLVVISDGDDNQSHATRNEAITTCLSSSVVIFTIDTSETGGRGKSELKSISENTGGLEFTKLNPKKSIAVTYSRILDEIGNQYQVIFVPAGQEKPGQLYRLNVDSPASTKRRIRAPKAYSAK